MGIGARPSASSRLVRGAGAGGNASLRMQRRLLETEIAGMRENMLEDVAGALRRNTDA